MVKVNGRMLRQPRGKLLYDEETKTFTIKLDDEDPRNSEFWADVSFTKADLIEATKTGE